MSVMTKGFGTSNRGGAVVTKGLQSITFIPPTFVPTVARARVTGDPSLVKAHTPTSVYRAIFIWLRGFVYG